MTVTDITLRDDTAGTFSIGGELTVRRLGFGAMRITGEGIWGEPRDHDEVVRVLRRAIELGVTLIDTADSYGPEVSEPRRSTPTQPTSSSPPRAASSVPARDSGTPTGAPSICDRRARGA